MIFTKTTLTDNTASTVSIEISVEELRQFYHPEQVPTYVNLVDFCARLSTKAGVAEDLKSVTYREILEEMRTGGILNCSK